MLFYKPLMPIFAGALLLCSITACEMPAGETTVEAPEPTDIWANLDRAIGDAPVVALGEPSHFLKGIHEFNVEMFKYLVENKGFRVFCFESFWQMEFLLQDFLNSDREDLNNLEKFYMNAFSSKESVELLRYIRQYNRTHPDDPLAVIGYQPEQPVSDTRAILDYLQNTDINWPAEIEALLNQTPTVTEDLQTDLDAVVFTSQRRKEGLPGAKEEEYEAVIGATDLLYQFLEENKTDLSQKLGEQEYTLLWQRTISLNAYGKYWMKELNKAFDPESTPEELENVTRAIYQKGDSIRAEIFLSTMNTRYKNKKAMIWMHNWHAAKRAELTGGDPQNGHPPFGTRSFGTQMREKIGSDYVVIASVVACPDCTYDRSLALEERFFEKFGQDTIMINLHNIPESCRDLPLDQGGTFWMQAGSSNFENVNPSLQFDALLYLPKSELTIR